MAKLTAKQKSGTRKQARRKLAAQQSAALQSAHKVEPDQKSEADDFAAEQSLALAVNQNNNALEEFFTTAQDAAINRFADAALSLPELSEHSASNAFLSCRLGDEEYGIELNMLREILRPVTLTPVPHVPAPVLGVMSLRGQVMPVIDLAMHIGLVKQKLPQRSGQRYIVLSYAGELLCFRVDGVDGVVSFDESGIEPPPQDLDGLGREYVFGIGRAADDRMLLLLDLDLAVGELLPGEQ